MSAPREFSMTTGRTLHNLHTGASVMDQESFAATIQEKSLDTHFDSISILLIMVQFFDDIGDSSEEEVANKL